MVIERGHKARGYETLLSCEPDSGGEKPGA
jgi:hypothetical protein